MKESFKQYKEEVKDCKLPKHLAIILDGNGTWAKRQGLERNKGHRKGADALIRICRYCLALGIDCLTVYAFSTENWTRPAKEVDYLMKLLRIVVRMQRASIIRDNIQFRVLGTRKNLSDAQIALIQDLEDVTKNNTGMHLNVAFNYGSYEEIIQAVKHISTDVKNDVINVDDITPDLFGDYLYTHGLPPVDLLIRTSGQYRISNFLLWQIAYSEFYFPDTLWPDFTPEELNKAIFEYNKRDRRFGGIKCEKD